MYDISKIDVSRFTQLLRATKNLEDWDNYYENLFEQMEPIEYEIQKWWANKIDLIDKEVAILNSGVGFYAVPFCFEKGAKVVRTYDMCPITNDLAWRINKDYHVPVEIEENSAYNYFHSRSDVVFDEIYPADIYINTSCEHCYPMKDIIPDDSVVILSGNNLTKRGHINRINSIQEFIDQTGVSDVWFKDELSLDYEDELGFRNYKQFFIIGKKG